MKWLAVASLSIGLYFAIQTIPDIVLTNQLLSQIVPLQQKTRGVQDGDINGVRIEELQRRITVNDDKIQALDARSQAQGQMMAVMQADLKTMFELGRIVLGAAIVYLVQMIGTGLLWASGRAQHGHKN